MSDIWRLCWIGLQSELIPLFKQMFWKNTLWIILDSIVWDKMQCNFSETIFGNGGSFKNNEKCFLFHLESSFLSQIPFYFSFIYLENTSHKFWDQTPYPHYQCCLQVTVTGSCHELLCCCTSNMLQHWAWGRGLICFCKVGHSRISINFSRDWLGLNNLCEKNSWGN